MPEQEKRNNYLTRTIPVEFKATEDDGAPVIEGYFAVFNSNYNIDDELSESIAPGAFTNTISGDIRALINHDTTLVLGRTTAHTLELREDSRGLWGKIKVNPKDSDAMNMHARVERGDVTQCSIGFRIVDEETEFREDGTVHWTIREIELFEVSCCTFPAYEDTGISARHKTRDDLIERENQAWRSKQLKRLKKEV